MNEDDARRTADANDICGSAAPLTGAELGFLCELTGTSFADVAAFLPTNRSNVTYWIRGGRELPRLESYRVKKWFWRKLFPARTHALLRILSVDALFDDTLVLARMRDVGRGKSVVP